MRQKITKMLLSMMLAVVCVLSIGITVYADAEYDSGMTKEEVIVKYTVDTGNEQADKVFNQYLDVVSDMLVDDTYSDYFVNMEAVDDFYEKIYVAHESGSAEEWDAKTTFEKMLWYELYYNPLITIAQYSYDDALSSFDIFSYRTCSYHEDFLKNYDENLAEAYIEIMEWQYYYIVENGAVYNFVTGTDSLGRTEIPEVTQFVVEESVEAEPSEENEEVLESSEAREEVAEPQVTAEPEVEEEKGIWDDVIQSLKEKWLTFIILGVLVIAFVAVTAYRKSKGIDDDKVA